MPIIGRIFPGLTDSKLGGPCITEDTALCFKALNGLPGPYIKYFMKELGHQGLNDLLVGFSTKEAWALCTFAYSAGPGSEPILFEGRTDGNIVPARGSPQFGWDATFEPVGTGKTYANKKIIIICYTWLLIKIVDTEKCLLKRKKRFHTAHAHSRN